MCLAGKVKCSEEHLHPPQATPTSGHTHLIIQGYDQGVGIIGHEGRAATNSHLFWYNSAPPQEYWDLEMNILD